MEVLKKGKDIWFKENFNLRMFREAAEHYHYNVEFGIGNAYFCAELPVQFEDGVLCLMLISERNIDYEGQQLGRDNSKPYVDISRQITDSMGNTLYCRQYFKFINPKVNYVVVSPVVGAFDYYPTESEARQEALDHGLGFTHKKVESASYANPVDIYEEQTKAAHDY